MLVSQVVARSCLFHFLLFNEFTEGDQVRLEGFSKFMEKALLLFSGKHAEELARLSAGDFVLPEEFYSSDLVTLRSLDGSLDELVRLRQLNVSSGRFNVVR